MKRGLYWFRNDLRVSDNELLAQAANSCSALLLVYLFNPSEWGETKYGFPKTGPFRTQFLIQALSELQNNLQARNSDLIFFIGDPEEIIPKLCKENAIDALFFRNLLHLTREKQIPV